MRFRYDKHPIDFTIVLTSKIFKPSRRCPDRLRCVIAKKRLPFWEQLGVGAIGVLVVGEVGMVKVVATGFHRKPVPFIPFLIPPDSEGMR